MFMDVDNINMIIRREVEKKRFDPEIKCILFDSNNNECKYTSGKFIVNIKRFASFM
tara:strand:+ start:482 stop:649 length:168 start_codon:yes stop_codon:yes gene_type:complete